MIRIQSSLNGQQRSFHATILAQHRAASAGNFSPLGSIHNRTDLAGTVSAIVVEHSTRPRTMPVAELNRGEARCRPDRIRLGWRRC